MVAADSLRESIDSVRTWLDDLQAELEAGARCAERIHDDATTLDARVVNHGSQLEELRALVERVRELRTSIREQRTLLRNLRGSVNHVRRSIRDLRRE